VGRVVQLYHLLIRERGAGLRQNPLGSKGRILHPPYEHDRFGSEQPRHVFFQAGQQRLRPQYLPGEFRDSDTSLRRRLRLAIVVHLGLRQGMNHGSGHDPFDEEVLLEDLSLHATRRHDARKDLEHQRIHRPEPRVAVHDPADAIGSFGRDVETDRTTPVLDHEQEPVQVEVIDELSDDAGVLVRGVAVSLGTVREPEARIVDRDASESVLQAGDDLAIQKAPCRVAVQQQDRGYRRLRRCNGPARQSSRRSVTRTKTAPDQV